MRAWGRGERGGAFLLCCSSLLKTRVRHTVLLNRARSLFLAVFGKYRGARSVRETRTGPHAHPNYLPQHALKWVLRFISESFFFFPPQTLLWCFRTEMLPHKHLKSQAVSHIKQPRLYSSPSLLWCTICSNCFKLWPHVKAVDDMLLLLSWETWHIYSDTFKTFQKVFMHCFFFFFVLHPEFNFWMYCMYNNTLLRQDLPVQSSFDSKQIKIKKSILR